MDAEMGSALNKRRRKGIWRPFLSAIKEYALVSENDRIAVCISGGKDSMLLALCMRELQRHSPLHFELRYICMDPGYSPEVRRQTEANARQLGIPLEFFETRIFDSVTEMNCKPCYMCAKMRRGSLYRQASALGCNKIALGHHYDDVIETLLLSIFYSGQLRCMRPKLLSDHVPGMQLIRPLYKVREQEIMDWRDAGDLHFLPCSCRFAAQETDARRRGIKQLIRQLEAHNPQIPANIFHSVHNAVLDGLNGWKLHGETHSFLEEFHETEDWTK